MADPRRLERDVRAIVADFGPRDHAASREPGARRGVHRRRTEGHGRTHRVAALRVLGHGAIATSPRPSVRSTASASSSARITTPSARSRAPTTMQAAWRASWSFRACSPACRCACVSTWSRSRWRSLPLRGEFMGSSVHARSLRKEGVRLRGMIALEMIGTSPMRRTASAIRHALAVVDVPVARQLHRRGRQFRSTCSGARSRVPCAPPRRCPSSPGGARLADGVDFSDHASYWDAGYDAVMVTDTAFFRNPHYHTATDTPETLDYARMAQVVDGVARRDPVLDIASMRRVPAGRRARRRDAHVLRRIARRSGSAVTMA